MPDVATPIYILRQGKKSGPFTLDDIYILLEDGTLSPNDIFFQEGMQECGKLSALIKKKEDAKSLDIIEPQKVQNSSEQIVEELPNTQFSVDDEERFKIIEKEEGIDDYYSINEENEEEDDYEFDEELPTIVWKGNISYFYYWKWFLLTFAIFLLGTLLSFKDISFLFGSFLIVSPLIFYIVIDRNTRDYIITPTRVEFIEGIIAKTSREVRIKDIRTINVISDSLLSYLGVNDVEFSSAGGDGIEVKFSHVWRGHKIKKVVRRIQDL